MVSLDHNIGIRISRRHYTMIYVALEAKSYVIMLCYNTPYFNRFESSSLVLEYLHTKKNLKLKFHFNHRNEEIDQHI